MPRFRVRPMLRRAQPHALGAVCTVALAAMQGGPALAGFQPFNIKGWVQPLQPLQSPYLHVHYHANGGSGCNHYSYIFPLGVTALPGVRTHYSVTVQTGPPDSFDPGVWSATYSVIGVYDDEEGAVSLSFHPLEAESLIAAGNEWEYFAGEIQVAVWLQTGATAELMNFMLSVSPPCSLGTFADLGHRSPLVAYSHAVANGTSFFEVECDGANGDTNCDGIVNFFDIDPFLDALFDSPGYVTDGCNGGPCCAGRLCAADADDSGFVNFFDIDPFLTCLLEQPGCP